MPEENQSENKPPASYQLGTSSLNQDNQKPTLNFLQSLLNKGKKQLSSNSPQASSTPPLSSGQASSGKAPSLANLLGPKPVFSRIAFMEAEKRRVTIAKSFFRLALIVALVVYGFFTTQLNPNFTFFVDYLGPNVARRFESTNAQLQKQQTDLNRLRMRLARLWLDDVNSQIDPFKQNLLLLQSDFSTAVQKQNAAAELQILGSEMKRSLAEVQKILSEPMGIDTYSPKPISPEQRDAFYESLLKEEFTKERAAVSAGSGKANPEELRIMDQVIRFVENKRFREMIRTQDLGSISEENFNNLLTRIREEGTDELSMIEKIRSKRLNWANIINDIHLVARKADLYYGQGLFKTAGGFLFSSYQFDAKTGRISITGITKTSDNKTFSAIAKLVDSIEKSPRFRDIDFRSFSKSRDESGDFSSSINLEFSIQKESDPRDDVVASKNPPHTGPAISEPQ